MSELAWAAGFFDGEGTVTFQRGRLRSGNPKKVTMRVSLMQCDPRPLQRFIEAVGYGKLYGPYDRKRGRNERQFWYWEASRTHAEDVLEVLWPFMSEPKREQSEEVRSIIALENLIIQAGRAA